MFYENSKKSIVNVANKPYATDFGTSSGVCRNRFI